MGRHDCSARLMSKIGLSLCRVGDNLLSRFSRSLATAKSPTFSQEKSAEVANGELVAHDLFLSLLSFGDDGVSNFARRPRKPGEAPGHYKWPRELASHFL